MANNKVTAVLLLTVGAGVTGYVSKLVLSRLLGYIIIYWLGFASMLAWFGYLLFIDNSTKVQPRITYKPFAFLQHENWSRELRELSKDKPIPTPIFPESFLVSDAIDDLLEYIIRDFILSWYRKFTADTLFPAHIDAIVRQVAKKLEKRVMRVDWADCLVGRILPVITDHFKNFVSADMSIRGHSRQQFTESSELDHNVAKEYAKFTPLHSAINGAKSYEFDHFRRKWLRNRIGEILPDLLEQEEVEAEIAFALTKDIVSNSVVLPVLNMLSDPDFWNQTVLKAGSATIQDQQKVEKLIKALDAHSSNFKIMKLRPDASSQEYDHFIRSIYRLKSLTELRKVRYYISVQVKRTEKSGESFVYKQRLNRALEIIEKQIKKLSGSSLAPAAKADLREDYTLSDILNDSACSLYFMEFMDQRRRTGLLQFWLTVNSLRDDLEFEGEDADPLGGLQTSTKTDEMANSNDILQIYQTYLHGEHPLSIGMENIESIRNFSQHRTPESYKVARKALLDAQSVAFKKIEQRDLSKFKESDLFLKFMASAPVTQAQHSRAHTSATVDQLQMDNIAESSNATTIEDYPGEALPAMEEALNDIMNSTREQVGSQGEEVIDEKELHLAGPGDLGLTEAISLLSVDIDKLYLQLEVLQSLYTKAELTNNTAELRIIGKSRSSLEREIQRKELQRQQYTVQESENSLFGRTKVSIQTSMKSQDYGGEYILYLVEVSKYSANGDISAGWIVARRYSQFLALHQHLRQRIPSVGKLEFPKKRMTLTFQQKYLVDSRRIALEKYLSKLLAIQDVCRSKAFRQFLSSETFSVENLSEVEDLSNSISSLRELPVALDDTESELIEASSRPFVEPICDAFIQIFGVNKGGNSSWLRGRAVVVVVQQLLGGTIEKKIRELIEAATSERRLTAILQILTGNLWPGGAMRTRPPARSPSEKAATRREAQAMLQQLIVDTSSRVVGLGSCRYAANNLFAMYQNEILNGHLVYTCLDLILEELLGEQKM